MTPIENPQLSFRTSGAFEAILRELNSSIVFTTYDCGKIFWVGHKHNADGLQIFERTLERCMALWRTEDAHTLYVSSAYQIWVFENRLKDNRGHYINNGMKYAALYAPQRSYVTGNLDIHDIHVSRQGYIFIASTAFNCIATLSNTHNFDVFWQPSFAKDLSETDCCHLNGFAVVNDRPTYATAFAATGQAQGWKHAGDKSGIIIDMYSNEIICHGLDMPHSPRWHNDKLWIHNSGTAEFGYIDISSGLFIPLCECNGFLRNIAFHGDYAMVTTSTLRTTFKDLPLGKKLSDSKTAIILINISSGNIEGSLELDGNIGECYAAEFLPNIHQPAAIGLVGEEIKNHISIGP